MMMLFKQMLQEQREMSEITTGSTTARATKRAIQRKGRVRLSTRLQGGDATIWNLGKIASDILQSGGYG